MYLKDNETYCIFFDYLFFGTVTGSVVLAELKLNKHSKAHIRCTRQRQKQQQITETCYRNSEDYQRNFNHHQSRHVKITKEEVDCGISTIFLLTRLPA